MKISLSLIALSLVLPGCNKMPGDAEIRQKIVGTWTPTSSSGHSVKTEMNPDGHFSARWQTATNEITMGGEWSVKDGFVSMTVTNVTGADLKMFGAPTQRYKVVRIGDREIVSYFDDPTNLTRMVRE